MADIQPTLDLIDGAIEDYISPDAMRWTPDEDQRAESRPSRGLSASRLWIDGVEVTEHVRSIDLGPMVEEVTRYDISDWREHISSLRTVSWNLDVPMSVVVEEEPVERPDLDSFREAWDLMSSPETGRILDEWLAEFQREPSYRHPPGGEVGDMLGIPVIESPLVPEGHLLLVNPPRLQDFSFAPGPFSYSDTMHTSRMMAHFVATPLGRMVIFDEVSHKDSRWIRLPRRGAGWTAPRNNPRVRALHAAYRHRQLARRRRRK